MAKSSGEGGHARLDRGHLESHHPLDRGQGGKEVGMEV